MSATGIVIGFDRGSRAPWGVRPVDAARRPDVPASVAAPRLTRRGRLVVTLVLTALIVTAFAFFGGSSVATRQAGTPEPVAVIEVEQGQTLWGIASTVAEPGQVREMVYRIRELNSLPGSSLVEGQELAVPVE